MNDVQREQLKVDLTDLKRDFVLILGTETVFWDIWKDVMKISALRSLAGSSNVNTWLRSAERRTVRPEDVVFDPQDRDEARCNLFDEHRMLYPTFGGSCKKQLELLRHLCSGEANSEELYEWILNWQAYPVQNPGAKMQTALLFHGPGGTGKNQYWESYMRVYGEYGGIFGQAQLESQFNAWSSRKLFMLGDEVVSRQEKYHLEGQIKSMITGERWQVNEKNMPVRIEKNLTNFVLLSNRIDIAKLDQDDRRFCVVWTPPPADVDLYHDVADEIQDEHGSAALHRYLKDRQLPWDFGPHSRPPMTRAKRDLINVTSDSVDRFISEWEQGSLPVPYAPCRSLQLYAAYKAWAAERGIPRAAPDATMLAAVGKRPGVRRSRMRYMDKSGEFTQKQCIVPLGQEPEDSTLQVWLTGKIDEFDRALTAWRA